MYPPSKDQFRSFLLSQWSDTRFVSCYLNDRLISVAVTDMQTNGLSAIYTFFDPEESSRSLGVYSVLKQIELCADLDVPYLYLGYWIKDSRKMSYKTDYRPVDYRPNDCRALLPLASLLAPLALPLRPLRTPGRTGCSFFCLLAFPLGPSLVLPLVLAGPSEKGGRAQEICNSVAFGKYEGDVCS